MNMEIGTEASIFLFWEYLFRIFGILSLQSGSWTYFKTGIKRGAANLQWAGEQVPVLCSNEPNMMCTRKAGPRSATQTHQSI